MIISEEAHRVIKKMSRDELDDFITQQRLDERHLAYVHVYEAIHELEKEVQGCEVDPVLVLEELLTRIRRGGNSYE